MWTALKARTLSLSTLVVVMGVYCSLNLRLESNVTNFMPDESGSELAALSRRLADSELARTMVLSIRGPTLEVAKRAAAELAGRLAEHDAVAWVRSGVDPAELQDLYELYFARRHYFLSDDPERELPDRYSAPALTRRARDLKRELSSPAAPFFKRLAAADPLADFARIVERVRDSQPALRIDGGQFVSFDGEFAILMLGTKASAFDHGRQAPLLEQIRRDVDAIASELGASLELEQSGTNRFAAHAQSEIRRDVYLVSAFAFAGVAMVFVMLVGSLRAFAIVFVPTLTGLLAAMSLGLLFFDGFDGLTLAFGAVLIGVATDYSVHALVHHRLAPEGETPSATVRRLRPTLTVGAITTMASFVGLAFTAFPAFREISVFSIVGLAVSLGTTLVMLPELLQWAPPPPDRARRMATRMGRLAADLGRPGRLLFVFPAVSLLLIGFAVPKVRWVDDMSAWARIDPELLAEDQRVRARVTRFDASRFVIVLGADLEEAIETNSRVHRRLGRVVEAGGLDGMRSLHAFLWSESLQRRNLSTLLAEPGLRGRVIEAFSKEGFRADAFRAFGDALDAAPLDPLTLEDLRKSGFGSILASFVFPIGQQTAVITYLRGIGSNEQVAEAIEGLEGVRLFEQRAFLNDVYGEFRATTVKQLTIGILLVATILVLRYRKIRPAFAALLPSIVVALSLIEAFAFFQVELNLLHVMTLIMVLGMGVDYGIFIVDTARDEKAIGVTLLSLLVSCLTTALVFGTLMVASQPALRAIGLTAGVGIVLAFIFSPLSLLVLESVDAGVESG